MVARILIAILACTIVSTASTSSAQLTKLADAETLLLRGNYAESEAEYLALLDDFPVQASLGLSYCYWEQGEHEATIEVLEKQLAKSEAAASVHAQRAWIGLQVGDWATCREQASRALELDRGSILGAFVQADLHRAAGEFDLASNAHRKLAERYDQDGKTTDSPRELHWFAQALAQHARLNGDKKRFSQLTNQIYPRILSLEPNFWPAHFETGRLLLEKYNAADAESSFNDALQINSQAADAHAGMARLALGEFQLDRVHRHVVRALKTNPKHLGALLCRADAQLASLKPASAHDTLNRAVKLNPRHAVTLGRLSASESLRAKPNDELANDELPTANRGEYYASRAAALEHARRYPQAGDSLRLAIRAAPRILGLRSQLGMIEMRLGHEQVARQLLEESFGRDPYNVRVKNQLEVLDLLDTYALLETEHFILRYDADYDESLARHMSRYAERCYDELTATFDFELPEKALIELFHDGQGIQARQWFGARMVGLPNIHTIAACGGNIVAMVSPTAEGRRLNWADILRHEIVHLINIQQTDYAVPHWLTEGCAVWQENRPRRPAWNKLLVARVPRGDVFNLDTINLGFLKPRSADDWHLAYCQAEQYVDLIARKHGVDAVRNLLSAYRDNLPAEEALERCLGVSQAAFEENYAKELAQIASNLSERIDLRPKPKLAELAARWEQNPADWETGAELALARLRRGDYPGAGRLARQVLEADPDQPSARLVKAKLLAKIGDEQAAKAELRKAIEGASPPAEALKQLATIHLRQRDFAEAKRLYSLGAAANPDDVQWTKALAVVAIRQQDNLELNRQLVRIASAEPDNLVTRKKLLQLAQADEDQERTEYWANEVLHIDPNDLTADRALRASIDSNTK